MRTVLNILNFVLGGFATTFGWLVATFFSIIFIITLPLTRSCWEITKLSLIPYGNEAVHVDELDPQSKNSVLNAGGTVLNIVWLVLFGWWLCLTHITVGITQCISISLAFLWVSPILKSPPLRFGRSVGASCRLKWLAPRAKPMRVVAFSNRG